MAHRFTTFEGLSSGGLGNLKPFSPPLKLSAWSMITSLVSASDSWLISMVCTARQFRSILPATTSCAASAATPLYGLFGHSVGVMG